MARRESQAFGPGCAWRRAGGAAMSCGSRTAGVKPATATISAIFLIPGRVPSSLPAFLRCSGRMAMPLPSPCIMITSLSGYSSSSCVAGAPGVEVVRPGGEVLAQPGELGSADRDAGAGPDDLLGLPEPARGQMEGRQGPHPQRVRVARQGLPGVGGIQVRLPSWFLRHTGHPSDPALSGQSEPGTRLSGTSPHVDRRRSHSARAGRTSRRLSSPGRES
jgi:hypothetical protein